MPELPDVIVYTEALTKLLQGSVIDRLVVRSPFVLRTFSPTIDEIEGTQILGFSRRGKRIVWHLENERFLVFHLMIAGRFHWSSSLKHPKGKNDLLAIHVADGTMMLTEASTKKRAGLWIVGSLAEVEAMDPGGLDVLHSTLEAFTQRLQEGNHTLKRALTSPRILDGIGNAYSDEILHAAQLSPFRRTSQLKAEEWERLHQAAQSVLQVWTERLREDSAHADFPEKVTAFREEMAVHGKFGQPCPVCGAPVQRICYSENECNYCPGCQTDGNVLADRSLSRLLKDDWPRTVEEWESMFEK